MLLAHSCGPRFVAVSDTPLLGVDGNCLKLGLAELQLGGRGGLSAGGGGRSGSCGGRGSQGSLGCSCLPRGVRGLLSLNFAYGSEWRESNNSSSH